MTRDELKVDLVGRSLALDGDRQQSFLDCVDQVVDCIVEVVEPEGHETVIEFLGKCIENEARLITPSDFSGDSICAMIRRKYQIFGGP